MAQPPMVKSGHQGNGMEPGSVPQQARLLRFAGNGQGGRHAGSWPTCLAGELTEGAETLADVGVPLPESPSMPSGGSGAR